MIFAGQRQCMIAASDIRSRNIETCILLPHLTSTCILLPLSPLSITHSVSKRPWSNVYRSFLPVSFYDILVMHQCVIFVAFVEDNATMSSIRYFENHVSYFVQIEGSRPY